MNTTWYVIYFTFHCPTRSYLALNSYLTVSKCCAFALMWILDLILLTDNKMMLHGPKQSLAGIIQDNSYAIYNPCFFFVII